MAYKVAYSLAAATQIEALYMSLAEKAGEMIADSYIGGLQRFCEGLAHFPKRGTRREGLIIPGLRIIG
ncbi:hypothetical protein GCM10008941_33280 [Rhizomicrobium palustre]